MTAATLREVTKAYPGMLACEDITIDFWPGEIHALVGENGAGKSTLVKILAGLLQPNSGSIEVGGHMVRLRSARASRKAGIGVVHQFGSLIETMTVGENVQLGGIIQSTNTGKIARSRSVFKLNVPEECLVRDLSPRDRQLIEIYRLLGQDVKVLVLDEPTATLSPQEANALFDELRLLADAGYAVVVVSHKLSELLSYADRFTVLRKGRLVAHLDRNEATAERLIALISGPTVRTGNSLTHGNGFGDNNQPLVRLSGVGASPPDTLHEAAIQDVDLLLHRGEVLGVAGRPGSGAKVLLSLLYGKQAPTTGSIKWLDRSEPRDLERSIGFIPADRLGAGAIALLTLGENLMLRRRSLLNWQRQSYRRRLRSSLIADLISQYDISPANPNAIVGTLSGGNLQKVLLARELDFGKDLLLAESPTAGLDVRSSLYVKRLLREKARSGVCVVVHSDDIDELVDLVDRVVVMSGGRVVDEIRGSLITRESIGRGLMGIPSEKGIDKNSVEKAFVTCID